MPLKKPPAVESDQFKSAKWDELAEGRDLSPSDAPALELLVQWYSVIQRCIDDMADANGQVAYMNDMGDLRALPQIQIMKQASAEIRQLSRQLGIADGHDVADTTKRGGDVLEFVTSRRKERRARAQG